MGSVNPIRWSTKYTDDETDLVYYGYRYYSPRLGRWLSRDPIGEEGGANVYVLTSDDPVNFVDPCGRITYTPDPKNCVLNVTMKWRFDFEPERAWGIQEADAYRANADATVQSYFNGLRFRCVPKKTMCSCPNGLRLKLTVLLVGPEEERPDFAIGVHHGPGLGAEQRANVWGLDFRREDLGLNTTLSAELYLNSLSEQVHVPGPGHDLGLARSGWKYTQTPITHEAGHMFGLPHPSGPRKDDEAYYNDPGSLMGVGHNLRLPNFQTAFCDHIQDGEHGPWKASK